MPVTMATIIAVKADAMILFHSKDDIGVLSVSPCGRRHHRTWRGPQKIGFLAATQPNYCASGRHAKRASCRPLAPQRLYRERAADEPDNPDPDPARRRPAAEQAIGRYRRNADDPACLA